MPLFRLAGVGNFCFSLLSPFLSIMRILSSQAILFEILLPRSPFDFLRWSFFFSSSYFYLKYFGVDGLIDDMIIPLQTALNYHIFDIHNNTHPKNISRRCIDQSHATHHPDRRCSTLRNLPHPQQEVPTFHSSATNWSNTTLISLFPLLQQLLFPNYHTTLWTTSTHYQFSISLPHMLYHKN